MTDKKPKKPPLTDAERHQRFKDMAREVDADECAEAFDKAFAGVVKPANPKSEKSGA